MRKIFKLNEKGMTLIELLAVLVILSIISTIAVLSILKVIDDSKDRAFVANAYALRDAANLYLKEAVIHGNTPTDNKITYKDLVDSGYIEVFKDPDNGNYPDPTDATFVLFSGESISSVCLIGEERNLGRDAPIPIKDLSVKLIKPNK